MLHTIKTLRFQYDQNCEGHKHYLDQAEYKVEGKTTFYLKV